NAFCSRFEVVRKDLLTVKCGGARPPPATTSSARRVLRGGRDHALRSGNPAARRGPTRAVVLSAPPHERSGRCVDTPGTTSRHLAGGAGRGPQPPGRPPSHGVVKRRAKPRRELPFAECGARLFFMLGVFCISGIQGDSTSLCQPGASSLPDGGC